LKIVEERESARKEKNWEKSDKLREEIKKLGFEISDTSEGAIVKKIDR
jgi:cysteinyl-tRNA synthetase